MTTVALGVRWKGLPARVLAEAGVTRREDGVVRVPYFDREGTEHNAKLFAPEPVFEREQELADTLAAYLAPTDTAEAARLFGRIIDLTEPGGLGSERRSFHRARSWWETPGLDPLPYGLETLPAAEDCVACAVLVCEGESDALAARAAYCDPNPGRGIRAYSSGRTGATRSASSWPIRPPTSSIG